MRKKDDDKKTDERVIQRKIRVVTEQHVMYVNPRAAASSCSCSCTPLPPPNCHHPSCPARGSGYGSSCLLI